MAFFGGAGFAGFTLMGTRRGRKDEVYLASHPSRAAPRSAQSSAHRCIGRALKIGSGSTGTKLASSHGAHTTCRGTIEGQLRNLMDYAAGADAGTVVASATWRRAGVCPAPWSHAAAERLADELTLSGQSPWTDSRPTDPKRRDVEIQSGTSG